MKQINRCPNCGGLLPKSRTNTVKCEYCDSVFENIPSNEPIEMLLDCGIDKAVAIKTVDLFSDPERVTNDSVLYNKDKQWKVRCFPW